MEEDVPWTRPAAHGVCIRGGEILLARLGPELVDRGRWSLPGGGLDWGEDPADCVQRELFEETGLRGRVGDVLGVFSTTYLRGPEWPHHSLHFMSTIFEMHDVAGEPVHELEGSTDMAAWVPLASVRELDLAPLTERGLALWRQRSCSTAALTARAMAVRDRYARFETARFGREWTTTELLAGFMTDVGDLSRLVLAATGVREADDVEAKLAHELADCLWSVLVLGDRLGIDVGAAFASTMDDLERFLDDAT